MYVDGFVLPVQKNKKAVYKKLATQASKVWKEYGALEYYEAWGDDMKNSMGVAFPKLAKTKPNETVVFAWVIYRDKKHRDAVNKKIMKDKRLIEMGEKIKMPFDCKKMAYGGFKVIVKA